MPAKTYSDEDILDALRGPDKSPLSCEDYNLYRERNGGPCTGTIVARYEGWNNACIEAGLRPNKVSKGLGEPTYTDEDMVAALRHCLKEIGSLSYRKYEMWRTEHGKISPSAARIKQRFGWDNAVREAQGRE